MSVPGDLISVIVCLFFRPAAHLSQRNHTLTPSPCIQIITFEIFIRLHLQMQGMANRQTMLP